MLSMYEPSKRFIVRVDQLRQYDDGDPIGRSEKVVVHSSEYDELSSRMVGFEQAVSGALDEKLLDDTRLMVRRMLGGIQDCITYRDAAKLLNMMLEQVARDAVRMDAQEQVIKQADEILRECMHHGLMNDELGKKADVFFADNRNLAISHKYVNLSASLSDDTKATS
jgi:hypothetical protein